MTEEEHASGGRKAYIAFCKQRALEYVEAGDLSSAVASMAGDLSAREDTRCPPVLVQLAMKYVIDYDEAAVRRWIEGFN